MNLTCEQGTIMARVRIRFDEVTALPPVCVCCGAPATRMRRQEFQLNAALSAALLVTAAVLDALVWTKRGVTISLPVCEYHKRRGRRSNRSPAPLPRVSARRRGESIFPTDEEWTSVCRPCTGTSRGSRWVR
jgi:hypothetical protein